MNRATPEDVRATMAAHVLGATEGSHALGAVTLLKHQVDAARRLREIIRVRGGALLADEVGLGKTFVALSLASEYERVVIVAPASLRPMWRGASDRAQVKVRFVSMELLGHGATVPSTDLLIVDEAHHFRNDRTKRYRQLAEGCARCSVLLMSATPVQNRLGDLRNMLALVVGRHAHALSLGQLTELVIRRGAAVVERSRLPTVGEPIAVDVDGDADCLEQLCELPPPVPPSDGGHAHALLTLSLARQWASSRGALLSALTRRLAMARAMEDSLVAGRHPTRHELAMWRFADDAQQLAFPELAAEKDQLESGLLEQVRLHADAVRGLIAWLRQQSDIDAVRALELAQIAQRHGGERIVAFAEFTDTVTTLHRHLKAKHRAALLTHAGGVVAGGAVPRRHVLRQFAGNAVPAPHEGIDLLLTTDVLSEGVDLQGASVVVHLDLTWNPARMEQRVGRLRRLGAARDRITVYVFSPPAPAEKLLRLDQRLRAKLGDAARSIGLAGAILPGLAPSTESVAGTRERALGEIEKWLRSAPPVASPVAAIRWPVWGAVACVRSSGEVQLVVLLDGRVEAPTAELLDAIAGADELDCPLADIQRVRLQLEEWMERRAITQSVRLSTRNVARSRRRILDRVDGIARRARRHERESLARMLGAARNTVTMTMPAGAEHVLEQLARAPLPDDAWLRAVGEFGSIHGRTGSGEPDAILALLLLVPADDYSPSAGSNSSRVGRLGA